MGDVDRDAILAQAEALAAEALSGLVVQIPQSPADAHRIREAVLGALVEAVGEPDGCDVVVEPVGLDGAVNVRVTGPAWLVEGMGR